MDARALRQAKASKGWIGGYMGSIVILGVFVADTSYRAKRMPQMGETLLGESFALGPGGKGSNQAVVAGRLGGGCNHH